jgi:SPP1 gp7 family putative phage head morphogenesis protein
MPVPKKELDSFFEGIVKILQASLLTTIEDHLVQAFIQADLEMVTWGQTLGGIPIAYEGPPIQQAIDWAKEHCAKLVTKMDDETKARLAQVVADAIENKRGIPGLARDLRNTFDNMSKFRSKMIARTETNAALSQGSLKRMQDMGIDGKEWVTSDPCEICAANGDEGVIPVDQAFSSGDDAPPAHPNCVCALAPARLSNRE